MAEVKAFRALRYTDKDSISDCVCPPYDIINDKQREDYIQKNKHNIIRLEKPTGQNAYSDAKKLYLDWSENNILACDRKEGFYVYEEEFSAYGERKKIRGFFARVRLEEFSKGIVLPHEETLSKAKQDRFELMCATGCNFSPIYSMYSDPDSSVSSKISSCSQGKPEIEFTSEDGIVQRLWKIENPADIGFIQDSLSDKQLFIADGHHRYETALKYRDKLKADGVITDSSHSANYIMMFLIDIENSGLVVFPTHRVVKGLEGFDADTVCRKAEKYFDICQISESEISSHLDTSANDKAFIMCTKGKKYFFMKLKDFSKNSDTFKRISEMNPGKTEAYTSLDVTVLHSLILEDILGIDKQNMANQQNLVYTRDMNEAILQVSNDENVNCAFLINPTKVSQIKDAALAGEKMPQKSTYFYPKLITGLVMNRLLDTKEL